MEAVKSLDKYYVSLRPRTNDQHAVHREGCPFLPENSERIYLGRFTSARQAGEAGKKYFLKSCGCRFCLAEMFSKESNTRDQDSYIVSKEKMFRNAGISIFGFMN